MLERKMEEKDKIIGVSLQILHIKIGLMDILTNIRSPYVQQMAWNLINCLS